MQHLAWRWQSIVNVAICLAVHISSSHFLGFKKPFMTHVTNDNLINFFHNKSAFVPIGTQVCSSQFFTKDFHFLHIFHLDESIHRNQQTLFLKASLLSFLTACTQNIKGYFWGNLDLKAKPWFSFKIAVGEHVLGFSKWQKSLSKEFIK